MPFGKMGLVAGGAVSAALSLAGCEPARIIGGCEPADGVEVVCGLEKPEDIAEIAGTDWLLVSALGSADKPGQIVAYRPADGLVESLVATDDSAAEGPWGRCGPMPERLRPRGFHVHRDADGSFVVLVVNAPDVQRIENYLLTVVDDRLRLSWRGCVIVPPELLANDVAALPDGGMVVSHMFSGPRTWLMSLKFLLRIDTGYAVAWSPTDGWAKVEGSDVSLANGIEADRVTGEIYVAATYGQEVVAVNPGTKVVRSVSLPIQPDNLTLTAEGKLLAVGHDGIPLVGTRACRNLPGVPCSFDFVVVEIDPVTMAQKPVFVHRDGTIPGASVALLHRDRLYLGTVFGDRISHVKYEGL